MASGPLALPPTMACTVRFASSGKTMLALPPTWNRPRLSALKLACTFILPPTLHRPASNVPSANILPPTLCTLTCALALLRTSQLPPTVLQLSALSTCSTSRSPPTVLIVAEPTLVTQRLPPIISISACPISSNVPLPPTPPRAWRRGICAARRFPPTFDNSAPSLMVVSSALPQVSLKVTLPPTSFNSTLPARSMLAPRLNAVPIISVVMEEKTRLMLAGIHNSRSLLQPVMVTVSPSWRSTSTNPSVETLISCFSQGCTLSWPSSPLITTRGCRPEIGNVC